MNSTNTADDTTEAFELRFKSLFDDGKALAFPCSANGEVDLDSLSERARDNYLFARAVIGRLFAWPAVQQVAFH